MLISIAGALASKHCDTKSLAKVDNWILHAKGQSGRSRIHLCSKVSERGMPPKILA